VRVLPGIALAAAVGVLGAPSAARGSAEPKAAAAEAERGAVLRAMDHYAAITKLVSPDSSAACYTEDGELQLPAMRVLHGRAAIRNFLTPLAGKVEVDSVAMVSDELEVHAGSAIQFGHYAQKAAEKGKPQSAEVHTGRFAALWRKCADGVWRLDRLMMQPAPLESSGNL